MATRSMPSWPLSTRSTSDNIAADKASRSAAVSIAERRCLAALKVFTGTSASMSVHQRASELQHFAGKPATVIHGFHDRRAYRDFDPECFHRFPLLGVSRIDHQAMEDVAIVGGNGGRGDRQAELRHHLGGRSLERLAGHDGRYRDHGYAAIGQQLAH